MTDGQPQHEPVVVTDKRRIDPETGEARQATSGPAPSESAPAAASTESAVSEDTADVVAELTADLQRVQADFANYRKRALRDQQAATERAKSGVVSQLLGVLDDLERARSHGDLESGPLRSVADKLTGAMTALGLTAYGAEGDDFDPTLHEAVQHEGEGSRPVVGNVLRQGYRLGEQVLRHAMVGVVDTFPEDSSDADAVDSPDNDSKSDEQTAESETPDS